MSHYDVLVGSVTPMEELQWEIVRLQRARSSVADAIRALERYHADPMFQFGGHRVALCAPRPYCTVCEATRQ